MKVNNQKGFTIAELLVAMTIGLTVLSAVYAVYRVQAHTVKGQEYRMEAQEYARVSLDMMVREIRNLGYFPTRVPCPVPANTNGLVSATATSISFAYDWNGDGDCADAGPDESVVYTYDPVGLNITRAANGGAPDTLTIGNVTAFQLLYYPRQTGASAPAPYCISAGIPSGCSGGNVSSSLASVQRVSVSLTVKLQKTDAQFGAQQDITMNSNADLRNR
jgi:prepilin-type N-terminal cleavage/methylation domain-containing protein